MRNDDRGAAVLAGFTGARGGRDGAITWNTRNRSLIALALCLAMVPAAAQEQRSSRSAGKLHPWPSDMRQRSYSSCIARAGKMPVAQQKEYCQCVVREMRRQYSADEMMRIGEEPDGSPDMKVAILALQWSSAVCNLRTQQVDLTRRYPPTVRDGFLGQCRDGKLSEKACDCRFRRYQARYPLEVFVGASDREADVMKKQAIAYCDTFDEHP